MGLPEWWRPDVPTWVALVLGGAAVVLAILTELVRKPKLTALQPWFEADTVEKGFKRWHARFVNRPPAWPVQWISREVAQKVKVTIEFFGDGQLLKTGVINGIWSERPRPLRHDLVVHAQLGDLGPGEPWNVLIAFKYKGSLEAHPFDASNYRSDGSFDKVNERHLPEGEYSVRVILWWGARRRIFWFRLSNRTDELGVFKLGGGYKRNPIRPKARLALPPRP